MQRIGWIVLSATRVAATPPTEFAVSRGSR